MILSISSIMHICVCHQINEQKIEDAYANGAVSLDDLAQTLGLGSQCGRCLIAAVDKLNKIKASNVKATA
jgi:bacterioferritin-associated ferredoxin